MAAGPPPLAVKNLLVTYEDVILALNGVSIEVPEGGVVAVLGPNGAGKSTLLRAVSNVLKSREGRIEEGTIELGGERIDRAPPEAIARMGICHVPEGGGLFPELTVRENLRLGTLFGRSAREEGDGLDVVFEYFPALKGRLDQLAGYLSGGEQQMLALGRALLARPRLLLLDEPSLGLAPRLIQELFQLIGRINLERRVAILLVEQNARRALEIAGHGYVMEQGRVVLDDTPERLWANWQMRESYLGVASEGRARRSYREVKHYRRRKRWLS